MKALYLVILPETAIFVGFWPYQTILTVQSFAVTVVDTVSVMQSGGASFNTHLFITVCLTEM